MLVRSPTFTNRLSAVRLNGSSPDSRMAGAASGTSRRLWPRTASAMARTCSGVVPQHPPAKLRKPACANSPSISAVSSGASSYSPKALGSPAFG